MPHSEEEIIPQIRGDETFFLTIPTDLISLTQFREWVSENTNHLRNLRDQLGTSNTGVQILFDRLCDIWIKIENETDKLAETIRENQENSTDAVLETINLLLKEVSDGASFSTHSRFNSVLLRHEFSGLVKWGMLVETFSPYVANPPLKFIEGLNNQNQRSDFIFGRLTGAMFLESKSVGKLVDFAVLKSNLEYVEKLNAQLSAKIDDITKQADECEANRLESAKETDDRILNLITKKSATFRSTMKSHRDEMDRIRRTFEDHLSLKDASEYWNRSATNNTIIAYLGLFAFIAVSTSILIGVYLKGPVLLDNLLSVTENHNLQTSPILFLVFLTLPTAVALWFIRFPSKIFTDHFSTAREAKFRSILITTYLSLLRDKTAPISTAERRLALEAIFAINQTRQADDKVSVTLNEIIKDISRNDA